MKLQHPVKTAQGSVRPREWWFVALVTLCAVAWSLYPIIRGRQQTPPGQQFLYSNIPDTSDTQVYFAFIDQNAEGHALYRNMFTSEAQRPALFNPLWLVLGSIERLMHLTPAQVFILSRSIAAVGLIFVIYIAIALFIQSIAWRRTALLIAVFGGGVGGLLLLIHQDPRLVWIQTQTPILRSLPSDLTFPAGYTWLSIAHSPLFVVSQTLLLAALVNVWRGGRLCWAMLMLGILALIHPYDPVLFFGVLVTEIVIGMLTGRLTVQDVRYRLRRIGLLGLSILPAALYYSWAIWYEPVIRQWFQQNVLYSPPLTSLIGGFGVLSILALFGGRSVWKQTTYQPVLAWCIGTFVCMYMPIIPFQAKLMMLVNVPVAIFSTIALQRLHQHVRWGKGIWYGPIIAVTIVCTFSTAIVFPVRIARSLPVEPVYHYASNDVLRTLSWIHEHTNSDAIILGDYFTGNLVPQYAKRATYLGHNMQTIHYQQKLRIVREWFFGTNDDQENKVQFLREQHISFIVVGPNERKRGPFNPDHMPNLKLVHQENDVSIYAVDAASLK